MEELSGKVALVTGASRGIRRAIAIAPAQAGANLERLILDFHSDIEWLSGEIR
jgi:NADP-dependent 3-hydroxy acid dehydrogenase YdfG